MKVSFKVLALGLLLLLPFSAAYAQAPSVSAIADVALNANATTTLNVVAVDLSGRPITLTSSLPAFATLNAPTTGTGLVVTYVTLAPSAAATGTYNGSVTATAGGVSSTETFLITVNAAGSNRAPVVTAPALRNATAGSTLTFMVTANDADADAITSLIAAGLPAGATFTPNASYTSGTFTWTPSAAQAGDYDVVFTAANALSGAATTHIHVAPATTVTITPISDVTVAEGATATVNVSVACTAGAIVTVTASLPSFATLNVPTTGTSGVNTSISIAPPAGSAGTYHASVTATSNGVSATEMFDIIVTTNHAPTLSLPATRTVDEGVSLSFTVTASDVDGNHVSLTTGSLPSGANFSDNGNNTGTFTWAPGSTQSGSYTVIFTGNDGHGGTATGSTVITVNDVTGGENHAPTLSVPATRTVDEGVSLSFTVTASDVDGNHVSLTTGSLPSGANFVDNGNNTGTFTWTPGSTQSGAYTVTFAGNDGHGGTATAITVITVNDVTAGENHAPTLSAPATRTVNEGASLSFNVTANDVDGNHVSLTTGSLPSGANFVDNGNNTGTFTWTPGSTQSGFYTVTFNGNDGHGGTATATTGITVLDVTGGGGNLEARASLQGRFRAGSQNTCFRVRPLNGSFDVRNVTLSSIVLQFEGQTIAAVAGRTHLQFDCHDGDDGHDGDDDGDDDAGEHHGSASWDNPGEHHGDDDDCECDDEDDGDDDGGGANCTAVGIRACFSTQDILALFGDVSLPDGFQNATIRGTLAGGATFVATLSSSHADNGNNGDHGKKGLHPRAKPNPCNPQTELTFTMSRAGRVRVDVYDLQGRLVSKLLDESRAAGEQSVTWDASDARNQRVSSGVYFFRIQAPDGHAIQRIAVVK